MTKLIEMTLVRQRAARENAYARPLSKFHPGNPELFRRRMPRTAQAVAVSDRLSPASHDVAFAGAVGCSALRVIKPGAPLE